MSRSGSVVLIASAATIISCGLVAGQTLPEMPVLTGTQLGEGFFIGLNTSNNLANWLSNEGSTDLLMRYPSGQLWGSVFVTVGPAVAANRPWVDISAYQSLVLDLNGDQGTTVLVGIKDATQPDDGSETTVPLQMIGDWQTYSIPLTKFTGVNLAKIYVTTEFVFSAAGGQILRARNIRFSAEPVATVKILPQFAFGGGWYSAMYFTNTGGTAASFQVKFWGDDGTPMNIPSVGASTTVSLAPRGSAKIEAPNTGSLTQGYISAALPDGVTGYGVFRASNPGMPDQEAVVPLSSSSVTTSTLIWDDTNFVTAVAIVNPSALSITVAITARDSAGNTIGSSSVDLPPRSKTAAALRALPGLGAIAGNLGSADFRVGTGNIAVLGLRFNGQAFTSIPAADK